MPFQCKIPAMACALSILLLVASLGHGAGTEPREIEGQGVHLHPDERDTGMTPANYDAVLLGAARRRDGGKNMGQEQHEERPSSSTAVQENDILGPGDTMTQLSQVTDLNRELGVILTGIIVAVVSGAIMITIDNVVLDALYYGFGVAVVDNTPAADEDFVTRATWLVEDYVDWVADQNIPAGHAHEERHYYIPFQDWSYVYPTKEWVRPNPGYKASREWELRMSGRVIASDKARRKGRDLNGGDPNWSFRVASRDETAVNFTTTIKIYPQDISIGISGSLATLSFAQPVRDFVAAPNPPAVSWGLNPGIEWNTTEMPSSFEITALDVRWEIDEEIVLSADGKTDDELRREAIAGAVRLVPGERADNEWSPPGDLSFTIDDVMTDESGAYVVTRMTTVYLNDLMQEAGYDGLYTYDYVGPGTPDATTPLPVDIPDDGVDYTLARSESGSELNICYPLSPTESPSTVSPSTTPSPTPVLLPTSPATTPSPIPETSPSPGTPTLTTSPTECPIPSCCEEDCCGIGSSFSVSDGTCQQDPSSGGWSGAYSDDHVFGCVERTCCESDCCSSGTVFVESLGCCVGF